MVVRTQQHWNCRCEKVKEVFCRLRGNRWDLPVESVLEDFRCTRHRCTHCRSFTKMYFRCAWCLIECAAWICLELFVRWRMMAKEKLTQISITVRKHRPKTFFQVCIFLSFESLNSPGKWSGWGFSGSAGGCWRSERSCCKISGGPASDEPAKWVAKRWKFYAITPKTIKLGSHLQGMKWINYKKTKGNWKRDCAWRC